MPELDINNAVASDLTNAITKFVIGSETTDGPTESKETEWIDTNWNKYFGYYTDEDIPEITGVIDTLASWTVGKGYIADEETTMLLDTIKGIGFDTFNSILENAMRTLQIGGNFYAEIIRDEEENFINLKTLDPSVMKNIADNKGIIIRFEQMSKSNSKEVEHRFEPEEIFYMARNRVADEIHGRGIIHKLKRTMDIINKTTIQWDQVLERNLHPLWIFHLDTDDTTKIASFKAKHDAARGKGENMYIPKDVVVPEVVATAPNASLNPLPFIEMQENKFYTIARVPKIIVGGAGGLTEAAVKIAYLAFQQTIEEEQLYIEEQVLSQLNLVINLEFPASLENELLSDNKKDAESGATQPNDTEAGSGE